MVYSIANELVFFPLTLYSQFSDLQVYPHCPACIKLVSPFNLSCKMIYHCKIFPLAMSSHVLCELVSSVFYNRHVMVFYYYLLNITLISDKFSPIWVFYICIFYLRELLFNLACICFIKCFIFSN